MSFMMPAYLNARNNAAVDEASAMAQEWRTLVYGCHLTHPNDPTACLSNTEVGFNETAGKYWNWTPARATYKLIAVPERRGRHGQRDRGVVAVGQRRHPERRDVHRQHELEHRTGGHGLRADRLLRARDAARPGGSATASHRDVVPRRPASGRTARRHAASSAPTPVLDRSVCCGIMKRRDAGTRAAPAVSRPIGVSYLGRWST